MTSKGSMLRNRWFQLFILAFGAALIYQLPYLRYSYYDVMIEAFQVNNVQLGNMMSMFGLFTIIFYFPGGWLADRISNRLILSIGQILTGVAGLYFATFPPYPIALFISIFWAASTAMVFWTALIRLTRTLGSEKEQGRIFGLLEGGRGLIATLVGLAIVPIFASLGAGIAGLRTIILIYAIVGIVSGVISWFVLEDDVKEEDPSAEKRSIAKDMAAVLKMSQVWLTAIVFFATMSLFICLGYLTPYLTGIMGASVALAAAIGIIRTWGLQMLGGPAGGFVADKIGSSAKTLVYGFVLITVGFFVMLILPTEPNYLVLAVVAMMMFGFAIYSNRGVYFATLEESKVPMELSGSAIALITAVGGSPDAFMYTLIGSWLDNYPGVAGYNIIFVYAIIMGVVGFVAAFLLVKKIKNLRMSELEERVA